MNKNEFRKFADDRASALNWWRNLNNDSLVELTKRFYPERNWYSLTGREIHHIWLNHKI